MGDAPRLGNDRRAAQEGSDVEPRRTGSSPPPSRPRDDTILPDAIPCNLAFSRRLHKSRGLSRLQRDRLGRLQSRVHLSAGAPASYSAQYPGGPRSPMSPQTPADPQDPMPDVR